ncbi:MAG: hypothetical protein JST09_09985 [Bacteroidetes bacterium]|nr:hypothetical protein [Bacteroidota bacterium]
MNGNINLFYTISLSIIIIQQLLIIILDSVEFVYRTEFHLMICTVYLRIECVLKTGLPSYLHYLFEVTVSDADVRDNI